MLQGGASFLKIGKRNALAIAVCNCASFVRLNSEQEIQEVRIALGSVAPTPVRARQTEKALVGQVAGEDIFLKAGELASGEVTPITDVRSTAEYRKQVAGVLVKRTLLAAAEQASKRNR
jgi:carbon-monoxide dehydrogenase medium subunit